jgi:hypothetical protein
MPRFHHESLARFTVGQAEDPVRLQEEVPFPIGKVQRPPSLPLLLVQPAWHTAGLKDARVHQELHFLSLRCVGRLNPVEGPVSLALRVLPNQLNVTRVQLDHPEGRPGMVTRSSFNSAAKTAGATTQPRNIRNIMTAAEHFRP